MLSKAFVLLCVALYLAAGQETTCTTVSPCQAKCGSISVNLNKSGIPFPVKVQGGDNDKYTFYYSPCNGSQCGFVKDSTDNAVCQIQTSNKVSYTLGKISNSYVTWVLNSTNPYTFIVTYTGGDIAGVKTARFSTVTLTQEGSATTVDFAFVQEISAKNEFEFTVKFESLGLPSGGSNIAGVVGLVLIIVFFLAIATYLIAGALIMYFVKGARGVEIVPNYHFWKDFPFLIKDGMFFVISPCYKSTGYEKI